MIYEFFFDPLIKVLEKGNHNCGQYLIDILVFCVKSHGFRVRQFLIQNKILHQLIKLLKTNKKAIVIAVIKFFRAVLNSNDDILIRYIHTNGFLIEISQLLFQKKNGFNYGNLIFSACLELFQFVHSQNLKKIIKSLCENESFKQNLKESPIFLQDFFQRFFIRYEQYKEEDPFNQLPKATQTDSNQVEIEQNKQQKENMNLEELAYFENEESNSVSANDFQQKEVFNKEEIQEKKQQLMLLQNKIKRRMEEPEDEGFVFKKVHTEVGENKRKLVGPPKIDFVFHGKITEG